MYLTSIVQAEGRLLIVPASVFDPRVRFVLGCGVRGIHGVPGRAPAPTAPGWPPSVSQGFGRAGQIGAGSAQSRC
jgi:hypothetical protein